MSGMARSQVDMSLDDIIKLQKEQRKNVLKKPLAPTRRDRLRTRVLAARPRLQRRLRLQNTTGSPGRRQTRTLRGRQPRPNTSATTVSSSAALAVLKRARRTAVEAAKAAAQAAALINQSQSRRRDVFDANRNLPSRTSAGSRGGVRFNQTGFSPRRSRVSNTNTNIQGPRFGSRQLKPIRRRQRRLPNAEVLVNTPRFQGGQSTSYNQTIDGSGRLFFNNSYRRPRNNRPFIRQTNRGYYVNRAQNRNIAADQAREREYLAQARALIRAQSEQTQQFYGAAQNNNFGQHIGPARGRRGRRGYQSRY